MIPHDDGSAGPGTGLRLVLGSASPGRAEVLTRARVPFRVVVSGVDEAAVGAAASDPSPAELASMLWGAVEAFVTTEKLNAPRGRAKATR